MMDQKCKGAHDLLPQDMERFRTIEDTFRRSCLNWGYGEVKTPTLEYLHLFTAAGTLTPNMLSKVYSFLDWDGWSGERVVLRPDGTIPVGRLYIENLIRKGIAKLFYMTNVFIFEETGKEDREKWQCGVEFLGSSIPTCDVEIILLAIEILHSLGICDVELKLSHAGLLKTLFEELKLASDEKSELLDQIQDGNWQVLMQSKTSNADANRILSLLLDLRGKSSGFLQNLKALPRISRETTSQIDKFTAITSLLDTLGCKYQIDISSTKGFEYYTGLSFQLAVGQKKLGSGGRYDNLITLIGGKDTPACGFALYLDTLMDVLPIETQGNEKKISIRSTSIDTNIVSASFQVANSLREAGYIAELDFNNRQSNYRWIITIGEEPSKFTITDQIQDMNKAASSISEIVSILGGSA